MINGIPEASVRNYNYPILHKYYCNANEHVWGYIINAVLLHTFFYIYIYIYRERERVLLTLWSQLWLMRRPFTCNKKQNKCLFPVTCKKLGLASLDFCYFLGAGSYYVWLAFSAEVQWTTICQWLHVLARILNLLSLSELFSIISSGHSVSSY